MLPGTTEPCTGPSRADIARPQRLCRQSISSPLLLWRHGLQIRHDRPGIGFVHAERHHGKAKRFSVRPDPRREQLDHVFIARWWISSNSRRFQRPIWIRIRGPQYDRGAFERVVLLEIAIAVAGSVTLTAHGDAFDDVLASANVPLRS